ncbi:type II secretion system protein GspM [Curtobacterium pusillum]|uniref:type II secretion system protein GspM n=1 Tax=Curtobacterium pusillum TaxID=69373 RepID=UPI0037F322CD
MSRNRLMLVLAAVAALAVAAGGFFLGVQPQLDRAAAAKSEAQNISSSNATTRTEIARLREQAKSLPKMRAELAALRSSVPSSAAASSFISQLNATADATGVKVATITLGDAAAYTPPVVTTPATGTATDGASATATPTPTPSATPSAPAAPTTTTDSSITAENFSVIPVSISVNGEFAQALSFVKGVQSNPRLFLIDSISSSIASAGSADAASGADSPSWTFTGSIYVLTDTTADAPAKG